ncbi:RagB/SusD family nutrient uptake outer membrane protein [Chitinophaga solisilvae]|uniref:RagB/SusD family nutrient uptake outer membrane protein n=1 Tax=Chitinophaga solisilvae TaxID=1233460 RepID=UPI00136BF43A|nr:RagB/SusD family nutrient uptake outer membrane protein [Chitinophaga solisilvae]
MIRFFWISILLFLCTSFFSCKKLVDAGAPITSINGGNVFNTDAGAAALLTGIYTKMSASDLGFTMGECFTNLSLLSGLSADELVLFNTSNSDLSMFYFNRLTNRNSGPWDFWSILYPYIYYANTAIEGLSSSYTKVTPVVRKQLLGEAQFVRAFCYFYLVNLYGEVPLVLSTDYNKNSTVSRGTKEEVYNLIIADLINARGNLSPNFLLANVVETTTERVRPTKWAAMALLARAYLYTNKFVDAENQASEVIENKGLFDLDSCQYVFLKNSKEAIWQLQPVGNETGANTGAGRTYVLPSTGPDNIGFPVYLSDRIVNSFEVKDERRINWIKSIHPTGSNNIYYYPFKYKVGAGIAPSQEYIMVLRLAELYLIRSEARAMQSKLVAAISDINVIRERAGLNKTTASTLGGILSAIRQERKVELFAEWGDRWLDLKRTGTVNDVMRIVTPIKGGGVWNSNAQLYPIILRELNANKNLLQNPGY